MLVLLILLTIVCTGYSAFIGNNIKEQIFNDECEAANNMDIMVLIDTSCVTSSECDTYTSSIAELAILVKISEARFGITTFDNNNVDIVAFINHTDDNPTRATKIENIECNGEGSDGSTDVLLALQSAFAQFDYEENVYLSSIGMENGRDKKIILFSTCINNGGFGGESAVCSLYGDESKRMIDVNGKKDAVEITVFNILTSSSNLGEDMYSCLTGDDKNRVCALKLHEMHDEIKYFKDEICGKTSLSTQIKSDYTDGDSSGFGTGSDENTDYQLSINVNPFILANLWAVIFFILVFNMCLFWWFNVKQRSSNKSIKHKYERTDSDEADDL